MIIRVPLRARRKGAFTLVEMLVVLLIFGILLAIALPLYLASVRNAADSVVRTNMRAIFTAERTYQAKHQAYTANFEDLSDNLGLASASGTAAGTDSPFDGSPENIAYTVAVEAGSGTLTITATETGDVVGTKDTGESITYTIQSTASTGVWDLIPAP